MFRIDKALEAAYRSTTYVVRVGSVPLALRIGERSAAFERLLATRGIRSADYMTAWNPMSRAAGRAYNEAAARKLVSVLRRRGWSFVEGEGRGETPDWPPERRLLVLGIVARRRSGLPWTFGKTPSSSYAGAGRRNWCGRGES